MAVNVAAEDDRRRAGLKLLLHGALGALAALLLAEQGYRVFAAPANNARWDAEVEAYLDTWKRCYGPP